MNDLTLVSGCRIWIAVLNCWIGTVNREENDAAAMKWEGMGPARDECKKFFDVWKYADLDSSLLKQEAGIR